MPTLLSVSRENVGFFQRYFRWKAGVLGLGAIGMAVATVQVAKPGVYIVMSGQVFEAGAVRKNRAENCFEAT